MSQSAEVLVATHRQQRHLYTEAFPCTKCEPVLGEAMTVNRSARKMQAVGFGVRLFGGWVGVCWKELGGIRWAGIGV